MIFPVRSQPWARSVKWKVRIVFSAIDHMYNCSEDLKPIDPERFKLFATIVSFNQTEVDQNNALDNLLSKFGGPIAANLEALGAILEALESLLTLPAFTLEQSTMVLNVVDQVVDVTGKVEAEPDSLKTLTNK